jgi:hypothetical protein
MEGRIIEGGIIEGGIIEGGIIEDRNSTYRLRPET